jgi:hypothetical protein
VLSLEIEDRGEVEVRNWAKHKKTHFYLLVVSVSRCIFNCAEEFCWRTGKEQELNFSPKKSNSFICGWQPWRQDMFHYTFGSQNGT